VSLGLDPGDYEDKFHLRRALSAKLTQKSIGDRLAVLVRVRVRVWNSGSLPEVQMKFAKVRCDTLMV